MIRRLDVKIVLVLLVTVLGPLAFSGFLVAQAIDTSLGLGLNAELADQLERSLEIQRKHIEELKRGVKRDFASLGDSQRLAAAVETGDRARVKETLAALVEERPGLRRIRLVDAEGLSVEVESDEQVPPGRLRSLPFSSAVTLGPYDTIEAIFAVDASILSAYKRAGDDFATYRALVEAPPDYLGNRFVWVYLAILGAAVVLSIVIGIFWARQLARRIHRLSAATALVAEGDLSVRVGGGSNDEVGRLVESFNGMVSELAVSRARIEYLQKISAWQEMARRLAHEIKNPLTPIQLAVQQLREKYDGDDPSFSPLLEQSCEIIKEEVSTLRRLTSDFSSFAKLPEVSPERTDLGEFLKDCEATLSPVAEQEGAAITFSTSTDELPVRIDRMMMKRVVDNLVRNAAEALAESGVESPVISVAATRRSAGRRGEVEMRVEDNGPGIPMRHRATIFDPYFTTKDEGTGLGLAISKKIVLEHGGRIWLDEQSKRGARFIIILPADRSEKAVTRDE
jgi:nitrogen fixation/metabolism regulation signal transduction histidine kinase